MSAQAHIPLASLGWNVIGESGGACLLLAVSAERSGALSQEGAIVALRMAALAALIEGGRAGLWALPAALERAPRPPSGCVRCARVAGGLRFEIGGRAVSVLLTGDLGAAARLLEVTSAELALGGVTPAQGWAQDAPIELRALALGIEA